MINLICIPSIVKIIYWVAMETVRFHITEKKKNSFFSSDRKVRIYLVPVNNWVPMKDCLGRSCAR